MEGNIIDRIVRQLWEEQPGLGVKELWERSLQMIQEEFDQGSLLSLTPALRGTEQQNDKHLYDSRNDDSLDNKYSKSFPNSSNLGNGKTSTMPTTMSTIMKIPTNVTKAQIKHAKAWIPYRYIPNPNVCLRNDQEQMITTKVQERVAYRATRQYNLADTIQQALEALGIVFQDDYKTWTTSQEVQLDFDTMKSPNEPLQHDENNSNKKNPCESNRQRRTCQYCHKLFPSRNHVFKHLRDPTSGCGTSIFVTGNVIPDPPSTFEKQQRKRQHRSKQRRPTARTARHATAEQSLWFGDLPMGWTVPQKNFSYLRALLFRYLPLDIPPPWIKRVIRKAYRKRQRNQDADNNTKNDLDTTTIRGEGEYYGYAIVVFRDAEEAKQIQILLHQCRIDIYEVFERQMMMPPAINSNGLSSFTLKVQPVENSDIVQAMWNTLPIMNDDTSTIATTTPTTSTAIQQPLEFREGTTTNATTTNATTTNATTTSAPATLGSAVTMMPGQDPPLCDQLRPLGIPELSRRIKYLSSSRNSNNNHNNSSSTEDVHDDLNSIVADNYHNDGSDLLLEDRLLHRLCTLYKQQQQEPLARPMIYKHEMGKVIPTQLGNELLEQLQALRWPAKNEREDLASERYLVLPTNAIDRWYGPLRQLCRKLMDWNDPTYYYSGIAVTKNFVASPHIDTRDQTFQYAVSLGNFTNGGELCVEGYYPTKNNGNHDESISSNKKDTLNQQETSENCPEEGIPSVYVVTTHNRICKVDGRRVHWVRTWEGGDRFSLIFYNTSERQATSIHDVS